MLLLLLLLLLLMLPILVVSHQGTFPQNRSALVSQTENRAKRDFRRVTRMVLALIDYYAIQPPTGSNPNVLKPCLSLWTCVCANRNQQICPVLHFLLVIIPFFVFITLLFQGQCLFERFKKISKSRVIWSEGSGTYPPVKGIPPKGLVVISSILQ